MTTTMDANGMVEIDLVHGEYNFTVSHPSLKEPTVHDVIVGVPPSLSES
jgi:hypothetical protein